MTDPLVLARVLLLSALSGVVPVGVPRAQSPEERRVVVVSDGWRLAGDLTRPNPEAGARAPAVLLLNGAARDRGAYASLARRLARLGIGSLRLDLRGDGESLNLGRFIPFDSVNNAAIGRDRIWRDVRAGLAFLRGQPWVDPSRLGALGASFSGEALAEAIRGERAPRAVVQLSPGSFSDRSLARVDRDGRRWLFVYSGREMIVRRWDMDRWTRAGSVTARVMVVPDSAHASDLLRLSPFLEARVAEWLSRALGAAPPDRRWLAAADRLAASIRSGTDDLLAPAEATPGLGTGEAGRLRFLLAHHRARRDQVTARAARRSAERLIAMVDTAATDSLDPSLYGPVTGPAIALLEAGAALADERYRQRGRRLLDRIRRGATVDGDRARWSPANDVLFGDAGTVAALFAASRTLSDTALRALALAGGRSLVARGRSDSGGISWRRAETGPWMLPNFSHGAAGVGTVLALLSRDLEPLPSFRDAARGAARYLDRIAIQDARGFRVPYGWPIPAGGWSRPFDASWAHGQAGTARLHWELWNLTRDSSYLATTSAAVTGLDSAGLHGAPAAEYGPAPFGVDYRFGLAGIGDFFADLYDETGDRRYLERALAIATTILARADRPGGRLQWTVPRWGFMPRAGEPARFTGLFHGAAGPGLLFLKLDALLDGRRPPPPLPDSPFGRE